LRFDPRRMTRGEPEEFVLPASDDKASLIGFRIGIVDIFLPMVKY
jgi:hypothetical protein